MIYFDNAATRKPLREAMAAAEAAMEENWFNPSAQYPGGKTAAEKIGECRAAAATLLGCKKERLFFTSGGTESINTAILSAVHRQRRVSDLVISSEAEHDATLNTLAKLRTEGKRVILLKPEADGSVSEDAFLGALSEKPALISLMAVNNETGAVTDIPRLAAKAKQLYPDTLFHVDAVQAFGKLPLDIKNIDLLSISAHKIGGLKGTGALYIKEGLRIDPLISGGGQEKGMRSGTENTPGIFAFGAACGHKISDPGLIPLFRDAMNSLCPGWARISPEKGSPFIFCFSPGRGASEVWVRLLGDLGFCISAGSACQRGKGSHVIAALPIKPEYKKSALRISFSDENTPDEVLALARAISENISLFPQ